MATRTGVRSDAELDLQTKLDIAATVIRLQGRDAIRRQVNTAKVLVVEGHDAAISAGLPTGIDLAAFSESVLTGLSTPALEAGDGDGSE
jgi:hypothetical protein